MRKYSRFITFGIFLLSGLALILFSLFLPDDFTLVSILCFVLFVVVFFPGLLDPHIHPILKVAVLIIGLLFLIASMLGIVLSEKLPVWGYCIIFAVLEIINGIAELLEGIEIVKEKNYVMGVLFIIDALIEVTLGILMSIEREATLRHHVILISADLFFEGIIKLINQFVEEKRGLSEV